MFEKKILSEDDFNDYMKKKQKIMQNIKKLYCDWTDKKKFFIHYRVLKFFVRLSMVINKVHEVISFKQSKWLEKKKF